MYDIKMSTIVRHECGDKPCVTKLIITHNISGPRCRQILGNLSTEHLIDLIGGLGLRLHAKGEISLLQASLLKLHDVKQVDLPARQAPLQDIQYLLQLLMEYSTGHVGLVTCSLADHPRVVQQLGLQMTVKK